MPPAVKRVTVETTAQSPIPDFCQTRPIVVLALIIEMVAILLTLADSRPRPDVLPRFVMLSLFLQWISLCSAAVLCQSRRWLGGAPTRVLFPVCWGLLILVTLLISDAAWWVSRWAAWDLGMFQESRFGFVMRNVCISAIVTLFLLRYFWVQNQWRLQLQAESEARYQALQARIRPHFLFNSLNSIAALVGIRPEEAEHRIEDLAELFRVSLDVRSRLVPLSDELDVVRAYLRIEQARLGERMTVEWDVPAELLAVEVPLLSVQPLAENAVYHGIGRLTGPGTIRIRARAEGDFTVIELDNPMPDQAAPAPEGLRMAIDNIAQRLGLIYGERAAIELGEQGGRFHARLRLPVVVAPPRKPRQAPTL